MEFKNFEELNNKVNEILENFNLKNDVNIIRKSLDKDLLNSFCKMQNLNKTQKELLNTNVCDVKLSIDSVLKNKINHPDLQSNDYNKINEIIKSPDLVKYSKNKRNCILILKKYNKTYQIVIKTTINRNENYLTSFRIAEH